jgi:uncharacterized protein YcbX
MRKLQQKSERKSYDQLKVVGLWKYPLKGARGQQISDNPYFIEKQVGVLGDRQVAIKKDPARPNEWMPKAGCYVAMNTPKMATVVPRPKDVLSMGDAHSNEMMLDIERAVGKMVSHEALIETKGVYNFVDTNPHKHGPTVSLLNLASVRLLEEYCGVTINPSRFRMNVWIDGLEPLWEYDWTPTFPGTREFALGALRFRAYDACERCAAIDANPETGERDMPLVQMLTDFMRNRGYVSPQRKTPCMMGLLLTPLTSGVLKVGDVLKV